MQSQSVRSDACYSNSKDLVLNSHKEKKTKANVCSKGANSINRHQLEPQPPAR